MTDPSVRGEVNHYENSVVGIGFEPMFITGMGDRPKPLDEPTIKKGLRLHPNNDKSFVGLLFPKLIHPLLASILSVTVS